MSEVADHAAPAGTACYVYGIVAGDMELPEQLQGVGYPPGEVTLIYHEGLAALVSECNPEQPLGTRDDLLAHETVLDTVAAHGTTLPMRFGAVLRDTDAVVDELLAANRDHFAAALEELAGHKQYMVKGRYIREAVLREVLEEEPEAMRLRDTLHQVPGEGGYYERIRLGEIVVQALGHKSDVDGQEILDALAPHAVAVSVHDPPGEEDVLQAAFLIEHGREKEFEDVVEEIGRQQYSRIRLRLLGPLAPYDFVEPAEV